MRRSRSSRPPMLLEDALGELLFHLRPEVLSDLGDYIRAAAAATNWAMIRVVSVVAAIP
ncbi:MAG TPA: hypothetical protein VKD24_08305 [Candidatus Angelobacter sp.]|nr:hypothetical protein [Candidatus Angelobacter sp.]